MNSTGTGTLGRVAQVRTAPAEPTTVDTHVTIVRPDTDKFYLPFFGYALIMIEQQLIAAGQGAVGQTELPRTDLSEKFEITFPSSLDEQKQIVAVLDQAFAALDRARARAKSNLVSATDLLNQAREQLLSLDQPGWEEVPLSDLMTIKHGFAFKSEFFQNDGGYVLLTPGNFYENGGFRHRGSKQKYYVGEIPDGFILSEGDLLMAMTEQAPGLLGSCILVPEDNRFLHNQRLGLIQPKRPENWHSPYFAHVFNLKAFRKALSDTCSGIKVRHTSPERILRVKVPVPPSVEVQKSVADQIERLAANTMTLTQKYSDKLTQIGALRKSLLDRAFSGSLT